MESHYHPQDKKVSWRKWCHQSPKAGAFQWEMPRRREGANGQEVNCLQRLHQRNMVAGTEKEKEEEREGERRVGGKED